jgi:putative acyl-CoA dehydrogenase
MQNVLADLSLETEAAALLAFRLSRAFDRAEGDGHERILMRLMTPIAKYWLCKRLPPLVVEAMECLGGNGYVEEAPLARLYREAPLNGIWEGSGNVICLDVLRSIQKEPASLDVLLEEVMSGGERVSRCAAPIYRLLKDTIGVELQARRIVESIAIALQASLMARHAAHEAADAFCASRLAGDWGHAFGTLPSTAPCEAILRRTLSLGPRPV